MDEITASITKTFHIIKEAPNLKPCHYCGSNAIIKVIDDRFNFIECEVCNRKKIIDNEDEDGLEKAINEWNNGRVERMVSLYNKPKRNIITVWGKQCDFSLSWWTIAYRRFPKRRFVKWNG